jgi:hypothetical protein
MVIAKLPMPCFADCSAWCFQYFVDQKQIGEQRAEMDRRIEVVDDLRADGRLREDQLDRGL